MLKTKQLNSARAVVGEVKSLAEPRRANVLVIAKDVTQPDFPDYISKIASRGFVSIR